MYEQSNLKNDHTKYPHKNMQTTSRRENFDDSKSGQQQNLKDNSIVNVGKREADAYKIIMWQQYI